MKWGSMGLKINNYAATGGHGRKFRIRMGDVVEYCF